MDQKKNGGGDHNKVEVMQQMNLDIAVFNGRQWF